MAEPEDPPAFMSALVTEHFALQSAASTTVSESSSRVTIYLSSLSSALVAIGFASSAHRALAALAFTVLPTVFVLGWFTIVRLVETSVTNLTSLRRIEQIRRYYASLGPRGPGYFPPDVPSGQHGVHYGRWSYLYTMASMVVVVNAVLGGAIIALVCALALDLALPVATVVGLAGGLGLLGLGLEFERRRVGPAVARRDQGQN